MTALGDRRPRHAPLPLFYPGETMRCPQCGGRHFLIGRLTAECARCAMAMPIALNILPAELTERDH